MQIVNDIKFSTYLKSKATTVVQDSKSHEDMKNALAMMNLLLFAEEDIRSGNLHTEEDVFNSVTKCLNKGISR